MTNRINFPYLMKEIAIKLKTYGAFINDKVCLHLLI